MKQTSIFYLSLLISLCSCTKNIEPKNSLEYIDSIETAKRIHLVVKSPEKLNLRIVDEKEFDDLDAMFGYSSGVTSDGKNYYINEGQNYFLYGLLFNIERDLKGQFEVNYDPQIENHIVDYRYEMDYLKQNGLHDYIKYLQLEFGLEVIFE